MLYRFILLSDEVDNFYREICIDPDATFLDLNNTILGSVGYSKDQMTSFFLCDENWEKGTEVTLVEMESGSEFDTWVMENTRLSELVEDEGQRLLHVFDYMTDRAFFLELKEIVIGKSLDAPACTAKKGDAPAQQMEFDHFSAPPASSGLGEEFYGEEFDLEELDEEGFDFNEGGDRSFDDERF